MMSDAIPLSVVAEPDVQITISDSTGREQLVDPELPPPVLPRGLYRVRLERCGFTREELISHESVAPRRFAGPLVESPAPLEISVGSGQAELARELSAKDEEAGPQLGRGARNARLFVFVRAMHNAKKKFPNDPVTIHDLTGRCLATLAPELDDRDGLEAGCAAMSCKVSAGSYRLRVGRARRDLAITIPAHRAAHVFLADRGTISLRAARVYLPPIAAAFDPGGAFERALESVLWALSQPDLSLPAIARRLLPDALRDASFAIACAHLALRQGDRDTLDQLMRALVADVPELPDVAILERVWRGRPSVTSAQPFTAPPLYRASLVLGLEEGIPIGSRSALIEATKTAHGDTVWCTWSPRWWDERWIEPSIDQLRRHRTPPLLALDAIARELRLAPETVERALVHLDAVPGGAQAAIAQLSSAGYRVGEMLESSERSIVYRVQRTDREASVAVKLIPSNGSPVSDADAHAVAEELQRLVHPRLVKLGACRALPDGSGLCLEFELCRDSLFGAVAHGPVSCDKACDLALQALDALAYLHDQGVVHGSIDPGAVLVRDDGTIALSLPRPQRVASVKSAGTIGSDGDRVRFSAPDAAAPDAVATPATDVWAMAATLYFLLTQELPRECYTDQSDIDAARDNPIVPIDQRMSGLPAGLVACLERVLVVRTSRRLDSAAAFQEALRDAVPAARAVRLHDELVRQDPGYATTLRNVFLRLAGRSGRLPAVPRDDFRYDDPVEDARVQEVLRRYLAAGLVTTEVDFADTGEVRDCVVLVHDELARYWTRIAQWHDELDAMPDARSVQTALRHAVPAWHASKRSSLLWTDRRVSLAHEIARRRRFAYNAAEAEFVRRSGRKRLAVRAGFHATVAALVVVSGCVVWQHEVATDTASAHNEVRQTLARSLQESGRQFVLDGRPLKALPYLVQAAAMAEPGPALQMLFHEASRGVMRAPVLEHKDGVLYAAFSSDGARVVTACLDGTATVWSTSSGERLAALVATSQRAHDAAVLSAAFSPDGKRIATASRDWTVSIWDSGTGQRLVGPLLHEGDVQSAAFSPDGKYVLTASLDGRARIWDAETGHLVHILRDPDNYRDAVQTAMYSADGTRVVTASGDGAARIWNAQTGAREHEMVHSDTLWSAAFSADGTRVVTASKDRTARIWDAMTGKPQYSENPNTGARTALVFEHRDGVTGASFDPSGRYVVTSSENAARVWDANTGAPITPWLEHASRVTTAAFNRTGSRLVTASADGTSRIWDTKTGRPLLPLLEHTGPVASAMFSPDGSLVVTASADHTARIWDATGGAAPVALAFGGLVRGAAFNAAGSRLVTASDDTMARIWNTATGALELALVHPTIVRGAAFDRVGTRVVTTSDDRVARIWDVSSGQMLSAVVLPGGKGTATFSPDGTCLVTASNADTSRWDGTLQIWDIASGHISLALPGNVETAALNRDGKRLVTLGQDRTVRVWDTVTGRQITQFLGPPGNVTSVAFSPDVETAALDRDGKRPVMLGQDRTVRVRDTVTDRQITQFLGPPGSVASVAFSPDGGRIVTAEQDNAARIWNVATGEVVVPALEHEERVMSASFSPDGARVVTVSGDRTAQVWDAMTGKPLTPQLQTDDPLVTATFSADGKRLLAADRHAVKTWDVSLDPGSPKDWSETAKKSPYVLEDGVLVLRARAQGVAVDPRANLVSTL